jgi:hypothetical protein
MDIMKTRLSRRQRKERAAEIRATRVHKPHVPRPAQTTTPAVTVEVVMELPASAFMGKRPVTETVIDPTTNALTPDFMTQGED